MFRYNPRTHQWSRVLLQRGRAVLEIDCSPCRKQRDWSTIAYGVIRWGYADTPAFTSKTLPSDVFRRLRAECLAEGTNISDITERDWVSEWGGEFATWRQVTRQHSPVLLSNAIARSKVA